MLRPVATLSGRASTMLTSFAGRASASRCLISSQLFPASRVCRLSLIRTSAQLPFSFSPWSVNLRLPAW